MASRRNWLMVLGGAALAAAGAAYAKRKHAADASPWARSDEGRTETESAQPFSTEKLAEPVAATVGGASANGRDDAEGEAAGDEATQRTGDDATRPTWLEPADGDAAPSG